MYTMNIGEYKVIDNFLPTSYFNNLKQIVESQDFSWSFSHNATNKHIKDKIGDFGLSHLVIGYDHDRYKVLDHKSKIQPFLMAAIYQMMDCVGATEYLRARFDKTLYNPDMHRHPIHADLPVKLFYWTSILYLDDSDGDTVIWKKRYKNYPEINFDDNDESFSDENVLVRVKPKQNRLVIFDGHLYHTGHSPSKQKSRTLLNTNFR